ncbi:MAG: preprotein translocase subunit SecG [Alphaproteobacteria bacterium]|nr:preprotein translocase subunit SecG [Alphaproteobacteria bacterium]
MEGLQSIVLVIHLFLAISLVVVILIQRSDGGALGGLGGSSGGGIVSARSAGNILTRTTSILATLFIITSLTLAILASKANDYETILDETEASQAAAKKNGTEAAEDIKAAEEIKSHSDVPEINLPTPDDNGGKIEEIKTETGKKSTEAKTDTK